MNNLTYFLKRISFGSYCSNIFNVFGTVLHEKLEQVLDYLSLSKPCIACNRQFQRHGKG